MEKNIIAPEKPAAGEKCNGCGFCCASERCGLAIEAIGEGDGPCPLMVFDKDRFLCSLVIVEESSGLEKILHKALGIGKGCDSFHSTEEY